MNKIRPIALFIFNVYCDTVDRVFTFPAEFIAKENGTINLRVYLLSPLMWSASELVESSELREVITSIRTGAKNYGYTAELLPVDRTKVDQLLEPHILYAANTPMGQEIGEYFNQYELTSEQVITLFEKAKLQFYKHNSN